MSDLSSPMSGAYKERGLNSPYRTENRPSAPGRGFISEVGLGCLILLLLIADQ